MCKDENYIFTFGKYKAQNVKTVFNTNPSYLIWANKTIEHFNLDKAILDKAILVVSKSSKPRRRRGHCNSEYEDTEGYEFDYGMASEYDW